MAYLSMFASACIFLLAEVPVLIFGLFGSKSGTGVSVIAFILAVIYLVAEDNHVWDTRLWAQLSTYVIMIVVCYLIYLHTADLFFEENIELTWNLLYPSQVTVIRPKPRRNWLMSVALVVFEYFIIFYVMVSFMAVIKLTMMVCYYVELHY